MSGEHEVNVFVESSHLSIPMRWIVAHENLEWIILCAFVCLFKIPILRKACLRTPVLNANKSNPFTTLFNGDVFIHHKSPPQLLVNAFKLLEVGEFFLSPF